MSADLRESPVVNTLDRAIGQQDSSGIGAREDVHECKGDELELELHDPTAVPAPTMTMVRMYFLAFSMMLTWFLGTASNVAVTILIPNMARDLEVTELEVQWVSSAYGLAYGCGMLISGRMADLFGRKLLYMLGLSIFVVFSIISGVLRQRMALCVVRAFAGLGLAIAGPAGYGIIGTTIRQEPHRTYVFAIFGLGGPIGASAGSLLGGAVAGINRRGWSYLFFLVAGMALIPIIIGYFTIPKDVKRLPGSGVDRRVDWIGSFLVTAGLSLFIFSLVQSGVVPRGWSEPYVPAVLVLSIVLLVVFMLWEYHLENRTTYPPVIKPSIFSRYHYKPLGLVICGFGISVSVQGWSYNTTIWYQNLKGYSALKNAIQLLPANIGGLIAAASVMYTVPRVRAPTLLIVGSMLGGIACMMYAVQPQNTLYWACEFIACLLLPYGIDYVAGVGNICMSNLVEQDEQSVAGALFQTSFQIGGALGISLSSLIVTERAKVTGSLLSALRGGFWFNAALAWIVPIVTWVSFRHVRLAKDVTQSR